MSCAHTTLPSNITSPYYLHSNTNTSFNIDVTAFGPIVIGVGYHGLLSTMQIALIQNKSIWTGHDEATDASLPQQVDRQVCMRQNVVRTFLQGTAQVQVIGTIFNDGCVPYTFFYEAATTLITPPSAAYVTTSIQLRIDFPHVPYSVVTLRPANESIVASAFSMNDAIITASGSETIWWLTCSFTSLTTHHLVSVPNVLIVGGTVCCDVAICDIRACVHIS